MKRPAKPPQCYTPAEQRALGMALSRRSGNQKEKERAAKRKDREMVPVIEDLNNPQPFDTRTARGRRLLLTAAVTVLSVVVASAVGYAVFAIAQAFWNVIFLAD